MKKSLQIFDKSIHLYADNILLYRMGSLIKEMNSDDFDMEDINDYLFSLKLAKLELRKRKVPLVVLCVDNEYKVKQKDDYFRLDYSE